MKVYLAGPISGLSYADAHTWRLSAITYLERHGHEALDPMVKISDDGRVFQWQERPWPSEGSDSECVTFDLEKQLRNADAVLVGFPTGFMSSIGTAVEVGVAWERSIPIIIWNPERADIHPFIAQLAIVETHMFGEAVRACYARR